MSGIQGDAYSDAIAEISRLRGVIRKLEQAFSKRAQREAELIEEMRQGQRSLLTRAADAIEAVAVSGDADRIDYSLVKELRKAAE
jgi:hypothetical protein